jgi:hypothetical protein
MTDGASRVVATRRWTIRLAQVVLVLVVVAGASYLKIGPSPVGPPATLHLWGKDYNSTGKPCWDDFECFPYTFAPFGPPPAEPITADEITAEWMVRAAGWGTQTPYVLHQQLGLRAGCSGLRMPAPNQPSRPPSSTSRSGPMPIYATNGPTAACLIGDVRLPPLPYPCACGSIPSSSLSSQIVNGPSLTRSTCMSAPKRPCATLIPWLERISQKTS